MGFTPRQVDEMSPMEFAWCLEGFAAANGAKPKPAAGPGMSPERARELGIEGF